MPMTLIHLYTDGACSGNPGPGGWGVFIQIDGQKPQELFGGEPETTNNRMEMMATLKGLEAVSTERGEVHIHTDSTYVKDGITTWVHNWQRNGWMTASKQPVKNKDLWQSLVEATTKRSVHWHWVKGHAGHPENERADMLARNGVMKQMMQLAVAQTAQNGTGS